MSCKDESPKGKGECVQPDELVEMMRERFGEGLLQWIAGADDQVELQNKARKELVARLREQFSAEGWELPVEQPPIKVQVKRLHPRACLPLAMSEGAAGFDLAITGHGAVPMHEPLLIPPRKRIVVRTGIAVAIPPGYEGQVRPRSGLALSQGVTVLNSPGTIDSDFRGELRVILFNAGIEHAIVRLGERIAQLVICPVPKVQFVECEELPPTARGGGGFGSTGKGAPDQTQD